MVWWLHGIAGIGKAQIARRLSSLASEGGHLVVWIEGQSVEPSPSGVWEALAEALGIEGATPEETLVSIAELPRGVTPRSA
jgi:adenylylsulfate kinase-like enzyme